MKISKLILALLLVTTLAACESAADQKSDEEREQARKEKEEIEAAKAVDTYKPHLICPQVAIIRELSIVRDYGNQKPNPAQLIAAAGMKNITGTCSYHKDGIDIAFTLTFNAVKGPRLNGEKMAFPFFVAVVDPDQDILNKDQLTTAFRFKGDEKTSEHDESLHVFIPLAKDKHVAGPGYRVLAGFQLTPDELTDARNREAAEAAQAKAPEAPAQKTHRLHTDSYN